MCGGVFVHRAAVEDWTQFAELALIEVFQMVLVEFHRWSGVQFHSSAGFGGIGGRLDSR